MSELSYEDVKILARLAGLKLSEEDLVEVTHRFNVIISDIEKLSDENLGSVDPVPFNQFREE
jgi:Asp-tRNA(Asn)/Glu-tRNA(Gln) amidotransferase C subunit